MNSLVNSLSQTNVADASRIFGQKDYMRRQNSCVYRACSLREHCNTKMHTSLSALIQSFLLTKYNPFHPIHPFSYYVILYYTVLYHLYYIILQNVKLCYIILCYVVLYYVMLYHIISYHVTSYYIIQYHSTYFYCHVIVNPCLFPIHLPPNRVLRDNSKFFFKKGTLHKYEILQFHINFFQNDTQHTQRRMLVLEKYEAIPNKCKQAASWLRWIGSELSSSTSKLS